MRSRCLRRSGDGEMEAGARKGAESQMEIEVDEEAANANNPYNRIPRALKAHTQE